MSEDPFTDAALASIEAILRVSIVSCERLAGGDVSGALLVTTGGGERVVVKRNATAAPGMFAAEADGLRRLGQSGAIRVPRVLAVADAPETAADERMIAMEYLPASHGDARLRHSATFGRRFGAALAQLHAENTSQYAQYGLQVASFLGRRRLNNAWTHDWGVFYRDNRIAPVLPECRLELGDLLSGRVARLRDSIGGLLGDTPHMPCLIHGDLWSGNYLVSDGEPALIDPAAYYGHPEHEWAYMELFGGFPPGMREGYDSVHPLDDEYARRRPLLQLFHLLVHVAHFGQPYVPAVDNVCLAYGF